MMMEEKTEGVVALETTNTHVLKLKNGLARYLAQNFEPAREAATAQRAPMAYEEDIFDRRSLKMSLFIEKPTPFSSHLYPWIDKKKLKDVDLYKKAQIDRKLFSKMKDPDYQPSKETVFKLVLALELSLHEAKEFMESVGFSFSRSSKMDLIVKYCIENQTYDLFLVNELLVENGEHVL